MEDLGKLAQNMYKDLFPEFGPTIIKSCTLNLYLSLDYNPATGTPSRQLEYTQPLSVIFTSIKDKLVESVDIVVGDKKALFPYLDVTADRDISNTDQIVEVDGSIWNILAVKVDPASAGYVLHIRRQPED